MSKVPLLELLQATPIYQGEDKDGGLCFWSGFLIMDGIDKSPSLQPGHIVALAPKKVCCQRGIGKVAIHPLFDEGWSCNMS